MNDEKIELEMDLLDLAVTYLQLKKKPLTAYSLCFTMEKILQWSERPAKDRREKRRLEFKDKKIFVHKNYIKKFGACLSPVV